MSTRHQTLDANEAVARVAYRLSEIIAIYPITPASPMGEYADAWAADRQPNLWGTVPEIVEMQSEGGAAGAVHGAGGLVTTFTASQGLLLMLPDLFKIAGELTAFCMHVAARTVATHALSIFGDHSDVMAARGTGFALLASGSAQEAQDLAAIGHAATLLARIPCLHFFDGFRTSHEITKVELLEDAALTSLIDAAALHAHRGRALDPDLPVVRGTSQNPDAYFQSREAVEPFYARCPSVVDATMARFAELTGRRYRLFDYAGHPEAERVIVMMGSGAECAHETVDHLVARGERVGVVKVRLFRPFSLEHFLAALPSSVRSIAVLDRTKEPGSAGEPLLLEITSALVETVARGVRPNVPRVLGGRYGLSSKELTPAMVKGVFDELGRDAPRSRFTVGIRDDVSGSSLAWDPEFDIEPDDVSRAVFFGLGSDGTVSANKATIKIIGEHTPGFAQGHFEYDSRKAGSTTISHLRFGPRPIRSTYRIQRAQLVAVHDPEFLERRDVLATAMPGAIVLVNTSAPPEHVWGTLPLEVQEQLLARRCRLYVIDGHGVAERACLGRRINTVMQVCFFALAKVIPLDDALREIRRSLEATFGRRGPEVVRRNVVALEAALAALHEVPLPAAVSTARRRPPAVSPQAPDFVQRVTRLLLEGRGDELPVSAFPPDGTWPSGTSRFEKRAIALEIPIWQPDVCVQCNFCSMICPHAAIQTKVFAPSALEGAPAGFRSVPEAFEPALEGLRFAVQVAPEDCTGCGLCIEVCPAKDRLQPRRKALVSEPLAAHRDVERDAFAFFERIESAPLGALPIDKRTAALRLPLFEFSGACAGCGETPYLRLLTQLYGDRLVIANATGCSSIYGGNLPTTPYTADRHGRGPAWANSLFEGNAGIMQLYDPDRVKKPLKRTNPDRSPGADPRWQELSWAQALDEIAGELRTLRDAGEAHKLLWISEDHSFTHVQGDFCTLYGTPNYGMHSNLCDVARKASFASVVGHDRPLADFIQSRYILLFGWNPVSAIKWVHLPRIITRAVEGGARLVVVDPYLSDTAAKAQEWVSIRPAPTAPSRSRSRTSSSAMASTTRTSSPAGPSASTSTPSWSRRRPPPGPSRSRRCAPP